MINRFVNNEKGSVVIIIALLMLVFLGFVALVVDGGLLYITEAKISNAMDAAALAGVQELPYHPDRARNKAEEYAFANGVDTLTIEITNNNRTISVHSERKVELIFAKVLGFESGNVDGGATAQVSPIVGVGGAVPLGIQDYNFEFGQTYTLKVGAEDGETGWFGALALSKPGAQVYEDNLTYGFNGIIRVGDILDIETGNMSNPTKRAIDYRMGLCNHTPYCSIDSFDSNCERLLKVPVIEFIESKKVRVLGFSVFLVDSVLGQGTDSVITGKFVRTVMSGEIDYNGIDYGLYGTKLTN